MDDPVLLAHVERDGDGTIRVRSPRVGLWSAHPHPGALLGPGSGIGTLAHLNRRFALLLPDGAAGIVRGALPSDRTVPVEYGELLLTLAPVGKEAGSALGVDAGRLGHPAEASLAPGTWAVVSPTDGTFYRRAAPGAPAFVEVGSRVRHGQAVGLVEVMKTFNQVLFGGPGFPEEAEVVEVRGADAQEVRAGQVLVVLR